MAYIISDDDKHLWKLVQKTEPFAETGWRGSSQDQRVPNLLSTLPNYSERRTATASWRRASLIIGGLSGLCWAALILFVIELLSAF